MFYIFFIRKRKVFDRLFDDYHEREDRFNEIKTHLEKLEALHWEEVLSILHLYSGMLLYI